MPFRRLILLLIVFALFQPLAGCKKKNLENMRGSELPEPLAKPDAVLRDVNGKDFDLRKETDGKLTLLFFGYTFCPDVCPMHMANIGAVLRDLSFADREKVRVLFVTVDPQRDTPERLKKWLANFDPSFVGLYEKYPGDLTAMSRSLFLPTAVTIPSEKGTDEYTVGHASQVIAFTPDGLARYVYPFGTRQEDWAHDLRQLLQVPARTTTARTEGTKQQSPKAGSIRVENVLIPKPPAEMASLYAVIQNEGGDDALLSLTVPTAQVAALHEQVTTSDGRMAMRNVERIAIPKGETRLAPGGFHGMLHGLTREYALGETATVVFEFQRAGRVTATAEIVAYEEVEKRLEQASK